MPTKTKLPGPLKALLILHSLCALAAGYFSVIMLLESQWMVFPVIRYFIPERKAAAEAGINISAGIYGSFRDDVFYSIGELLGFLMLVSAVVFTGLLLFRKKSGLAAMRITAMLEICIVCVLFVYAAIDLNLYRWGVLLLVALPFAAAAILSFRCAKSIKSYLENNP